MQAAGLTFALALPILIGVALLAACVRDASKAREAGLAPWILGAGYVVGAFVLTLLMRGIAVTGTPLDLVSIGVPGLAIAGALSWLAWRRSATGWRDAMTDARRTLIASDLARPARIAWFALLAWMAVRAGMLLVEVGTRPLYPWDAWSAWATKAKTFFALGTIVPFVDAAGWAAASTPVWFDAAPAQPVTLPLLQAWVAIAMGAWDDARIGLPWWLYFVSILLVVYGEVRRRGYAPLASLAAAWLAGSLPLLGTQVALAGYADLPLAAAFTLGTLAGIRAIGTRAPVDVAAAVVALAAVALAKSSGWMWLVVALPGFAAAALGPAGYRRIALGLAVVAIGAIGVAARFPKASLGQVSFAYDPIWETLAVDSVLLANWHLLAAGIVGTIAFSWRRLLGRDVAPLTLVVAAGAIWIAMLAAFPGVRYWGADGLGLNRAVLVLAPLASRVDVGRTARCARADTHDDTRSGRRAGSGGGRCAVIGVTHARSARRHARLRRHAQPCPRGAGDRALLRAHPVRSRAVPHRRAPRGDRAASRRRDARDRTARVAGGVLDPDAQGARSARGELARARGAVGRLRRESRRVDRRVPGL